MISCKRASELISKQADEPLTLKEELALKLHLFICESCDKFLQQVRLLRQALTSLRSRESESDQEIQAAPRAAKERLKEKLRHLGDDT